MAVTFHTYLSFHICKKAPSPKTISSHIKKFCATQNPPKIVPERRKTGPKMRLIIPALTSTSSVIYGEIARPSRRDARCNTRLKTLGPIRSFIIAASAPRQWEKEGKESENERKACNDDDEDSTVPAFLAIPLLYITRGV